MLLDRYEHKKYQSSLKMLLYVAVKELYKCDILFLHSLDKGIYCNINSNKILEEKDIEEITNKMNSLIKEDLKISRKVITKKDAYDYYTKTNQNEKASNILNLNTKTVTMYELKGYYNYFMSELLPSTKELEKFELTYLGNNNLVLSCPTSNDLEVPKYKSQDLILDSFTTYASWSKEVGINYVSDLNKVVSDSKIREFIKKNDIMLENNLYNIAQRIKNENKKIILLGGPSSSGKTTTTRKLSLYLSTIGLNPIYLSLDDYFKERVNSPKNEKGEYDFECLEAIELDLFNSQLSSMLKGEEVDTPVFNFITGEKEFGHNIIKLKENDIILIEGLHCLNEEISKTIPKEDKIKIYISPFMPLSIDRHNHISTVDIRLLRRIVRDNRTRGYTVIDTLKHWDKVRNGETKHVFPFTTEADVVLNTAHLYELGVLKVYVEPLLYSVPIESKYYNEARRLINSLQMFFTIPSEYISDDNILREFIGGSYFE